ncbi:transposase [Escherichia coli]|nr:transposase [Escherichia coli]
MHSENIAAYIGLDVHKETLAVAIAAPERLGEVRYYGTINNEAQAEPPRVSWRVFYL